VSGADNDGGTGSARTALLAARELGFLGPGPIDRHLLHAQGFVDLAKSQARSTRRPHILDLGSGGGLPGLVLADQWPESTLVLLDANQRRTDFLQAMVISCGFQDRVRVVQQRAEVGGRDPLLRGAFDGVVVRSFGPPAVVAECAAPFLREGGWLIVSEPPAEKSDDDQTSPDESGRWPAVSLAQVGLAPVEFVRRDFGYQVLWQAELCPQRFPRRDGVPSRKPIF
jgi:16S rRNA (guanine527-N7)-methyltransferase